MADEEATTAAGAASFDDFKIHFIQFIVFAMWMVYVVPIFGNLLDDKPLEWRSKLTTGWNYISGLGGKDIKDIKETQ